MITAEIYLNQSNITSEIRLESSILVEVSVGPEVIIEHGLLLNDLTTSLASTWSSQKIYTELSGKANATHGHAAADITESTIRRFVSDAEKAKWNGMTTTYMRANNTEKNAIIGMRSGDRCRVADDGDGKFAIYYWSGTAWIKDSDPDWENVDFGPDPVEGTFNQGGLTDEGNGFGHIDIDLTFTTETPEVTLFDNNGLRWVEVNNMVQKLSTSRVRIIVPYSSGTWFYKIRK